MQSIVDCISRKYTRDYPNLETCPHCYNSRGPVYIRERAIAKTDPSILESYGEGNWPLKFAYDMGEVQPNGNFLEREEVAVRHGACGDPEQVRTRPFVLSSFPLSAASNGIES